MADFSALTPASGSLFTEPVLFVSQKAKVFEGFSKYTITNPTGQAVGAVREVGASAGKKFLKAVTNLGALMSARFEIVDAFDNVVLVVAKPRTFIKGRMSIERPDGTEIGQIVQKLRLGKVKMLITPPAGSDQELAVIDAQNFRAWDFSITDPAGAQIASISKKWAGLGKEMFTKADNYVLEITPGVQEPLRSLCLASALTIDQLLKQMKS